MVRVGRWEGWGEEGVGGIDTDGWVLGPMCCDVFQRGCPKYTVEPMGRIVAKWSMVPSLLGVHPSTCDVCVCVVCGVYCVVCVVKYTAKPMGRIVAKSSLVPSSYGVHPSACDVCVWCVVCLVLCDPKYTATRGA